MNYCKYCNFIIDFKIFWIKSMVFWFCCRIAVVMKDFLGKKDEQMEDFLDKVMGQRDLFMQRGWAVVMMDEKVYSSMEKKYTRAYLVFNMIASAIRQMTDEKNKHNL